MPELGLAEAKQAINAASRAFKTWSKTTAKVRPCLALSRFVSCVEQVHPVAQARYPDEVVRAHARALR